MGKEKKSYNFKEREQYWRDWWEKEGIFKFNEKSKKPIFSVDTPPPYVSGTHLHQGHIMSYSQAEFIVRYKRMAGFEVYYPMGFDDNGLPTERFVEKKYNLNKNNIARDKFVKKCLEETKQGALVYKNLWTLLGISVDWTKTYSTIDRNSQRISQWSFLDLYQKGKVYRAKKPIMWCPKCQTAVAQADLEDEEKQTLLVFIKAKSEDGQQVVFATTRPELLPSCVGISVNPSDKRYKNLVGKKITLPLTQAQVKMTTDEMVDPKFGTGIVYFCSSGDRQFLDWETKHPIKNKIYLLNPDGKLNEKAGDYQCLTIKQARTRIVEDLQKKSALEKTELLTHTVNTHERCGTDIEYVESTQWFCEILNHKKELLKQAQKMNWRPEYMKQKYIDWVSGLRWDWCLSRQRYYGVPFPVWYCQKCGQIILANEKDLPVDPTIGQPSVAKCSKCGCPDFEPEKDVLDTWATSSLSPNIAAGLVKNKTIQKKLFPASLRPQAFEIIRTWLFYTVVKSLYHFNSIPFADIMIAGHGLDKDGRKISKRLGNFTPPEQIIENFGADALRYWTTGANLGSNLRYSDDEVKKGKRTVLKIFNASQLCLANFGQKNFSKLETKALQPEDRWLFLNLNKTITKATRSFEAYEYSKAKDEIDNFFWAYFCDNYLEFVKHRLYGQKPDKTAKQTLYRALLCIIKLYAPLLPFITEEVYQQYFKQFEKEKSVHLSAWPKPKKGIVFSKKEQDDFDKALKVVEEIRAYKSSQQLSQGKEIELFETKTTLTKKLAAFVQSACRVQRIKIKKLTNSQKIG